jgi:hypothetical protein
MVYALIHHYNSDEKWVYSELHTEDWWWQTQKKLSNDATVVSLLIFTDKTILTQHQGDLSAWSVYLTIENLNWHTRRAQSQPGLVLLDFLSVIENDDDNIKSRVWHMALFIILDCKSSSWPHVLNFPTDNKQQSDPVKDELNIVCADSQSRQCHPVIADFMIDYEEQILITGVKMNQQCTICQVSSQKQENLKRTDHFKHINSSRTRSVDSKKRRYQRMMLHEFTLLTTLHELIIWSIFMQQWWLMYCINCSRVQLHI